MKNLKIILLIIGILIHLSSYSQNDSIIKSGYVNMATLIVDYDTYNFEGGNISYYSCSDCAADSIPFTIDYRAPGDFGGITFKLSSLSDTVFDATIFWMGEGQIYYPTEFSMQAPFTNGSSAINKPDDLRYIHKDGGAMDSSSTNDSYYMNRADLAWNKIDQLSITNQFAEKDFKSAIYLYPPREGWFDPAVAKWIIFLYHNDQVNAINTNKKESAQLVVTPNPANGKIRIDLNPANQYKTNYSILNLSGQLIAKGGFWGSTHQLDVSTLKSGLYLLHLSDINNKTMATRKIIIE